MGSWPQGLASYAPAALLFVANSMGRSVSIANERSNKVVATVSVGDKPFEATIASSHSVYVTNQLSNTVSVITWTRR